jgi:transposase
MAKKKKRHTGAEITSKMGEASALAAQGRNQREIAQALGISVMTFHRWRKAMPQQQPSKPSAGVGTKARASVAELRDPQVQSRIAELQLENARLRRFVTDLLLEKMRLEDETQPVGRRANG